MINMLFLNLRAVPSRTRTKILRVLRGSTQNKGGLFYSNLEHYLFESAAVSCF